MYGRMPDGVPPNLPSQHWGGGNYALEWGKIPPKPPSQRQGVIYAPRMGGGSPQTPLLEPGG